MSGPLEQDGRSNQPEDNRDERIQSILNEVRVKRAGGQVVLDEDIAAAYPELLPELADALALFKKIQVSFGRIGEHESEGEGGDGFSDQQAESTEAGAGLPRITGYQLLRQIDRGGQAVIFLAIQESTQRKVAIKVLDGGAFVTPRKIDRFEREVKALVALDHPGIVRIIDRGRTADGSFFIAMDYVDGEDLDVYLARRRAEGWTVRQVVELFAKIAAALGEAHRLGIIHRDIKPSNIRIDARGEPRILDFGLARLMAMGDEENPEITVTQTGGVVGSLPWASPEQASGDSAKLCPGSDVYSLGVVFYGALVGRGPYDLTGTLRQRMHNICEIVPTFPMRAEVSLPFGGVDAILAGVILKCLEKQPAQRYGDGVALAAELEEYLTGRLQKISRRRGQGRFIAAVVMAMVVVGIAAAWTVNSLHGQTANVLTAKLPTIKNSIGMELVLIPAGTFRAGSPYTEDGHNPNEESHQVTLTQHYFMGRTEVTRGEYRQVMGSLPAGVTPFRNDDQLPVDYVSRGEAEEFCQRLSAKEGRHYRLPTEAEWENACRAGTNTPFSGTGRVDDMAWYEGNSNGRLQAVAGKQPNNWGLFDMEGNVSEWCADQFVSHLGSNSTKNPFAIPLVPSLGVIRGGSYLIISARSRAASRMQLDPNMRVQGVGLRVVMDMSSSDGNSHHTE